MKKLKVILIGAGKRGQDYTKYMVDERFELVGVAEPEKEQRDFIRDRHNIPEEMCFETWEPLLDLPKIADVAIIATMDKMHFLPSMKAIEKGYNLLLEKPIAPTHEECLKIARFAKEKGVKILVCHVLRYTPFYGKIKQLINEGKVGEVISIHHSESVGNVHQSHSFVRGNWCNVERSTPMILQKCCHDMDIMQWLMGKKCVRVHSFGSLTHFTRENAPEGAPEYCLDGCPHSDTCYYNAVKLYLDDKENLWFRETATKLKVPNDEQVEEVLRNTQYGKCVYKCDNDVVDHQVVNLEFEDGGVASFNMCAFNEGGRYTRVMGTKGEIYGVCDENTLDYYDFETRTHETITSSECFLSGSIVDGHGGGDPGIVDTLYKYIVEDYQGDLLSEIEISSQNHMIAFAAEKSRLENRIVEMKEFDEMEL